ncbi:MAG: DUF3990 domain-containing protein [Victivallales bacterium]|nr:DUF3990 domain-containing protein [Victivallales bacterium]
MRLCDGMTLYHGSYTPVEKIDLLYTSSQKDFGKGFYLTSDISQAQRFISTSILKAVRSKIIDTKQQFGYVSSFVFHGNPKDFRCFEFPEADEQWLRFVAFNRSRILDTSFLNMIPSDILAADIICGKVANDKTNPTITAYLGGVFGDLADKTAIETAIRLLRTNELKDQYCFLTQRAVQCLDFKEATRYE